MRLTLGVCIAFLCLLFTAAETHADKYRVEVARRHKNACKLNCTYKNRKNKCKAKLNRKYKYKYYSRPYSREYSANRHFYYSPYYDPNYYYYNDTETQTCHFFRFKN